MLDSHIPLTEPMHIHLFGYANDCLSDGGIPENYYHRDNLIYVVALGNRVTKEQLEWLLEHSNSCVLYAYDHEKPVVVDLVTELDFMRDGDYTEIDDITVAYAKFLSLILATEFKLRFADTYLKRSE